MARVRIVALAVGLAMMTACGSSPRGRERCAQCGMYVDLSPRWQGGATTQAGANVHFDTPICLLTFLRAREGAGARDAWVTDYYAQRRLAVADARFVEGTDVVGPMGRELVPVADDAAALRMLHDHHGRAVHRIESLPAGALSR